MLFYHFTCTPTLVLKPVSRPFPIVLPTLALGTRKGGNVRYNLWGSILEVAGREGRRPQGERSALGN